MSRPKPKILLEYANKETFKVEHVDVVAHTEHQTHVVVDEEDADVLLQNFT